MLALHVSMNVEQFRSSGGCKTRCWVSHCKHTKPPEVYTCALTGQEVDRVERLIVTVQDVAMQRRDALSRTHLCRLQSGKVWVLRME